MSRVARLSALLLTIGCVLPCGAQDAAPPPAMGTQGRTLVEILKARGALPSREIAAIEAAAELNPEILEAAANKVSVDADVRAFVNQASPVQLETLRKDLLNRAKLQAIASGTVPVSPELKTELEPYLLQTDKASLPLVPLPKKIDLEAIHALQERHLIVTPLCPTGHSPGKNACLEGDPWSESLFRSVVPILIDGKRVCTGTALGQGLILTAAHCVIDRSGTDMTHIDRERISVLNLDGKQLGLADLPAVPPQMMHACLPKCPDPAYDFSVLKAEPLSEANWRPLPLLSSISGSGDLTITMAGYGFTTMPEGLSKSGLYIGTQRLSISAADEDLGWTYRLPAAITSSNCAGDSGGPIFQGSPRRDGDTLALIGVISGFVSTAKTCFQAEAKAVNLSQDGPRSALCNYIANDSDFCNIDP